MLNKIKAALRPAIIGGLGLFALVANADASTVYSGTVNAPGEWGIIQFDHTGGDLTIDSLADKWTGGLTGAGIDDIAVLLFQDDGSPLTAFSGVFVTRGDESTLAVGGGDGSTSTFDAFLVANGLAAGSYMLAISHWSHDFGGTINDSSGLHEEFLDYQLTFSQDVLITAIDGVSAVPVPAALPLFGTGLAVMGFLGWRRKRKAT